ncbi:unnamed protein product, partial [Mesorhabditis belari]|uniref:Uncharacterized protein n=1 Tax=Mesorhabditis belari TaxID=2138241 RepID=A0AAF3EHN5_9BILA
MWLFVLHNLRNRQWLDQKLKGFEYWKLYIAEKKSKRTSQSLNTRYRRIEKDLYQYPLAKEDLLFLYKKLMIQMDPVHVKPALEEKFNCTINLRNRNWTVRSYEFAEVNKDEETPAPKSKNLNVTRRIPTQAASATVEEEGEADEHSFDLTGEFDDFMRRHGRRKSKTREELHNYHAELKQKSIPLTKIVTNFKKLPDNYPLDAIDASSNAGNLKRPFEQAGDENETNDSSPNKIGAQEGIMRTFYPSQYTELDKKAQMPKHRMASPRSGNMSPMKFDQQVDFETGSRSRIVDKQDERMTFEQIQARTRKQLTEILHSDQVLIELFMKKMASARNENDYLKKALRLTRSLRRPVVQMNFNRQKVPEVDIAQIVDLNIAPVLSGFEKEWHASFSRGLERYEAISQLWNRVWKQSGKRIAFKDALWKDVRSVEQKAFSFSKDENSYEDRLTNSIDSLVSSFNN